MTKSLAPALQAHLDSGTTTMALCWKVVREDGLVQGFTEHDRDLTVDGVLHIASSGFSASMVAQSLGLAVDNLSVEGALNSDTINEDDLANGLYDGAELTLTWVNWADPTLYTVLSRGYMGEVKRAETGFSAEFRSLSSKLSQRTGRAYLRTCDATLGDARCQVDLGDPAFSGSGTVSSADGRSLTVTGIGGFDSDWFTRGLITMTSGASSGVTLEVKSHAASNLVLWDVPPSGIVATDTFTITAGCKQDCDTCRVKFNNLINFQGFPFVPGTDIITSYPTQGEGEMDGGSLFT